MCPGVDSDSNSPTLSLVRLLSQCHPSLLFLESPLLRFVFRIPPPLRPAQPGGLFFCFASVASLKTSSASLGKWSFALPSVPGLRSRSDSILIKSRVTFLRSRRRLLTLTLCHFLLSNDHFLWPYDQLPWLPLPSLVLRRWPPGPLSFYSEVSVHVPPFSFSWTFVSSLQQRGLCPYYTASISPSDLPLMRVLILFLLHFPPSCKLTLLEFDRC